jgi:hypothetical protein
LENRSQSTQQFLSFRLSRLKPLRNLQQIKPTGRCRQYVDYIPWAEIPSQTLRCSISRSPAKNTRPGYVDSLNSPEPERTCKNTRGERRSSQGVSPTRFETRRMMVPKPGLASRGRNRLSPITLVRVVSYTRYLVCLGIPTEHHGILRAINNEADSAWETYICSCCRGRTPSGEGSRGRYLYAIRLNKRNSTAEADNEVGARSSPADDPSSSLFPLESFRWMCICFIVFGRFNRSVCIDVA